MNVHHNVIKNLKKWLTVRSNSSFEFTETDFMRLWKGLFYCMWMSDKPLVQEELAESLSKIVHCFDANDVALLYTKCSLQTLATEWFGIDQYRLDKFAMLVRRIIRQTFVLCKNKSWDIEFIKGLSEIFKGLLLHPKTCIGFSMHLTELLFEELSKVSCGNITEDIVLQLVKPFAAYLTTMGDERQIRHVMKHIFRYLILQSDTGMDYMEKFQAWQRAGFPAGNIDAMQKIEIANEEEDVSSESEEDSSNKNGQNKSPQSSAKHDPERPLDPRAGRVDVVLSQIPFNPKQIADLLTQYKFHPSSTAKSRRQILHLIKEFTELSQGKMPLGIKEIKIPNKRKAGTDPKKAAVRLLKFENELHSDNVKKKKRKRKRNGQMVDEKDDSVENTDEDTASDDEVLESEEAVKEEIPIQAEKALKVANKEKKVRKEKKGKNKKNANHRSKESVSNSTPCPPKRKKAKLQNKAQNNSETTVDTDSQKLKTSTSLTANLNNKPKNIKAKKNGATVANPKKIMSTRKKKVAKLLGGWHISENKSPPSPSSVTKNSRETSIAAKDSSTANSQVKKNDVSLKAQKMWLVPIIRRLEDEKKRTPNSVKKRTALPSETGTKKRVKIALQRNTAQHTSEYIQQIRLRPAIPFDANKKPLAGVLKASPISSPINPFYKRNIK